jgi:galactokinase
MMKASQSKNTSLASDITQQFKNIFKADPVVIRAPGRVNLIGEHTDYNNGFVLPGAINKAIYMAVSKRNDEELHLVSHDLKDTYVGNLEQLVKSSSHWPDFILGVIQQLQTNGYLIGGFNCVFAGDVPFGGGLSSSAAIECACIFGLNEIFKLGIDKLTMVKLGQKAENIFVGVQSGIMDQFASMFGKENHVIKLDCRSLEFEYIPFNMEGIKIVLFDTNIKHSLASSEYNTRRKQCEAGVALIKAYHSEVTSLREATIEMLDEYVAPKDQLIYQRCKYVVEEIRRLLDACADLQIGDLRAFGKKMYETHEGLSKQYEVSCKELDYLVDQVKNNSAVLGARMMGGGFGGCTINLVKEEAIDELVEQITRAYQQNMNRELKVYIAQIENGTSLLTF